jgi:hypothetical protein
VSAAARSAAVSAMSAGLLRAVRVAACVLLAGAWERAVDGRVEFACGGGRGRAGTALPGQRRYVRRFT